MSRSTLLHVAGKVRGVLTSIGPYHEKKRQKYEEARTEEVVTEMAARTIGIAVLGAGRSGTQHAAHVARQVPGATLVVVADVDLAAAQRAVEGAGAGRATVQYQELLRDPAVQAVVVATPTDTHAAVIADAAGRSHREWRPVCMEEVTND